MGLSEMMLGSVSNYVMHHAACFCISGPQMSKREISKREFLLVWRSISRGYTG
ncbi:hypothetical protein S7335_584 [Synechococcus sp. PCC 7335]|nr:hypothetical protein S7335_584 [Synechococcus sp. PCC 7335]